tara:strand:- start:990 stop:1910 length:921 start_codon:yes stop_codon:yes gene_type:complete
MAFTVTQANFNGKAAGFYLSAALKEAKSLEYLTVLENIKYKENIQKMAGTNLVADNTCDFAVRGGSSLALTEAVLEPKSLQINLDICKNTLLTSWNALEMRAGRDAGAPVSFEDYVISYMGEIIADATETSIWGGVTGNNGEFNGFTGYHLLPGTDATVVQSAAGGAYTATNIVTELQRLVTDILGGTAADVLGKDDAYIYMNRKTFQFYIQKMSTDGYLNAYNMQGDYAPLFEGVKIAVCPGMVDNQMVFGQKSNLFFGTDLLSDSTRIAIMDMAALDGSDNLRLVARYTAGVTQGVGADVVRQS